MVKNLPAMQETGDRYVDQEDPLEKGMSGNPTPAFLPGGFQGILESWTEKPGRVQSKGLQNQ